MRFWDLHADGRYRPLPNDHPETPADVTINALSIARLHSARLSKPQPHDTARWPVLADGGGMVTAMKRFITLRTDGNRVLVALDH